MPERFHIGQRIRAVWKRSGLTGTEFAEKLHRQRQSIYHLFGQRSIDTELLRRVSEALQHNFFEDYSLDLRKGGVAGDTTTESLRALADTVNWLKDAVNILLSRLDRT